MKHPLFQPGEMALVGPYPSNPSVANQLCTIERAMEPVFGAHRYMVELRDGRIEIVLEQTLRKKFERSDWGALKKVWQPLRVMNGTQMAREIVRDMRRKGEL